MCAYTTQVFCIHGPVSRRKANGVRSKSGTNSDDARGWFERCWFVVPVMGQLGRVEGIVFCCIPIGVVDSDRHMQCASEAIVPTACKLRFH